MAGGKETPRQKMIGMMYLVLTALLALQVSSAVLEKFIFINGTLEELVNEEKQRNQKAVQNIQATVQEKGSRPADVAAFNKAKQVRELSTEMVQKMDELKEKMVEVTGGRDPKTGKLVGSQDYDKVGNMMLTSPVGKNFEDQLDQYVKQLNEIAGTNFEQLTRSADDIEMFREDPNQKGKDFLTLTFQNTPTAAGLTSVTQLQAELLEYENAALNKISEQVGAKDIDFDVVVPMVRPSARRVAAGATYEADMFITASATGLSPKFYVGDKEIESFENEQGIKMGKVSFRAEGGGYGPDDIATKTFMARIELNDSIYQLPIEYEVVRPVITVRSAALQALYQNCGNQLMVEVPALGTNYNPSFSSAEAKTLKGNKPGEVIVVPQGRSKVNLTVSNAGSVLGTEIFDVKKVPAPRIELQDARGRAVNLEEGIPINTLQRAIKLEVLPDENFAREVPKDAQYRIVSGEARLVRGGAVSARKNLTGGNVSLSDWTGRLRKGDLIMFKIERVVRRTFTGDSETVRPMNDLVQVNVN
ncbi:MAG: gliding motility protein GldM [Candidatus Cyclobacteriaceae bacterium M2_1C_046]